MKKAMHDIANNPKVRATGAGATWLLTIIMSYYVIWIQAGIWL